MNICVHYNICNVNNKLDEIINLYTFSTTKKTKTLTIYVICITNFRTIYNPSMLEFNI